ncbi:DUF3097 domain-containing protein [Planosporangium thailandense]|uniref:DUF3097 domain-containing protein n=1 Tax=Planosporangium thailandense TaxID=765197 RepID=A0ABX0XYQ5_9ACTN|nr:DUF3097 domain-containing protein [Planosporangium thailandense]NJC70355.1 DUF3097 domain-containing protein [Planosporangium thailandense]
MPIGSPLMGRYDGDVLAGNWRRRKVVPEVEAELDLVVEDADSGFCGAVVGFEFGAVVLEDRHGRRRNFPLEPAAFLLDGQVVTLRRPAAEAAPARPRRTASGSVALDKVEARVARASRIWVEGIHDAALVERIWGDDLRIEGVVVEPLDGIDELPEAVRGFGPGPGRRLGVLVDHLVAGSKESRIVASITSSDVLVTGHPYVDIWQAVKPERIGIRAWPQVPRGRPWKEGVCAALGVAEPADLWRRILASVSSFRDVETPLIGAMERLIDFVTEPGEL